MQAGLTTRQVAAFSQKIADAEGNREFAISRTRMIQIENDESTPSVQKLYTLSAIYGVPLDTVLSLYVNPAGLAKHNLELGLPNTRLADFRNFQEGRSLIFPIRFDPAFSADRTNLLSRMVEVWGDVPVALLQSLRIREANYGIIGLKDYTMFPLIRPGSLVQIEEQEIRPEPKYASEFDRPIWFLELRDGYICSWCEFKLDRVVCVPHHLSHCRTREFQFPREAEVVGRVTAVAARLVRKDPAGAAPLPAGRSMPA